MRKGLIFCFLLVSTLLYSTISYGDSKDTNSVKRPVQSYTQLNGQTFTVTTTKSGDVIMLKENGVYVNLMNYKTISPSTDMIISTMYDKTSDVLEVITCPTPVSGVVDFSTINCVSYNFNVTEGKLINSEKSIPRERRK